MLKYIKENEGIHITGLAELLGVTKGAVSQIVKKLEDKGMITKEADPDNLSRLVLGLTPKGETAYIGHERIHRRFDSLVNGSLEGVPQDKIAFLKDFLSTLEEKISEFEKKEKV